MSNPVLILASALVLGAGPIRAALPVEGLVLPFRQVEVAAPVSSRITDMKVKEGEAVKEGQPLALLYGRLEELEAQRAKVLLERREFEAKGARKLYESRVIPEARALEARIDLDLARLQYETAAEQVRLRTVFAPMDGIVVTRAHDAGETVTTAQPLFRILDLSKVVVQIEVEPRQLTALAPGHRVRVSFPLAVQPILAEGEVVLVDPCADAQGRVRVKVVVENPERRIRSGIKALVDLPGPAQP
ncbi:MAG: efflux RND transporter periplasmic adaptor subunit [Geothrix sp.]|uniref:efflux RND transporter periplasmic adaptor subunit n=1 Tax=Geothrix sp. TaxID=1962974 RepID=UPI00180E538F|nr:efflux RND transporter periplasmic adaptor subunit [Geothrix sp.]NWJ40494.1 efflux RND transporter periplasmic adaptor subunit [Geothrix sp.]WIL21501.1 MAG: efflux RND transporter periplasmic adaptor subunit [Geothrix sp.]